MSSGKHYWEVTGLSGNNVIGVALASSSALSNSGYGFNQGNSRGINGLITPITTTVYGSALDLDNGALYVSQNGVWLNGGVPTSGTSKTGSVTIDGSTLVVAGSGYKTIVSCLNGTVTFKTGGSGLQYATPAGYNSGIYTLSIPPGAPRSPVVSNVTNNSATVTVSAPADNGSSSAVSQYTATSSPGGITATSATPVINVTGLSAATSYTFTVTATNAIGTGPASTPSTPTSTWSIPDAPSSCVASLLPGKAASVSFVPGLNGGSVITGYTVTALPGGATFTGAASPIAATGLTNGIAYNFTVTATNAVGTSAASSASPDYVVHANLPDAPMFMPIWLSRSSVWP